MGEITEFKRKKGTSQDEREGLWKCMEKAFQIKGLFQLLAADETQFL